MVGLAFFGAALFSIIGAVSEKDDPPRMMGFCLVAVVCALLGMVFLAT